MGKLFWIVSKKGLGELGLVIWLFFMFKRLFLILGVENRFSGDFRNMGRLVRK